MYIRNDLEVMLKLTLKAQVRMLNKGKLLNKFTGSRKEIKN